MAGSPDWLARTFEQVQVIRDPASGVLAVIAVHDTRWGPAFGGIRRVRYPDGDAAVHDALRLAEAMTLKCAVTGVPGGGGKAVIVDGPGLDRPAAYRLLGRYVAQMGGRYHTGPDVGTTAADLLEVAAETEFVARPGPGGPGDLAEPTALGVFAGVRAVAGVLGRELGGLRVAVQGLGAVGWKLATRLHAAGAGLVVADVRPEIAAAAADAFGAEPVTPEAIVEAPVDVFAPCALGGVIDAATVPRLRARAVAGAANNVLATPGCGVELFRRGVLYAPDFVVNSGALIHGALFHLEGRPPDPARIEALGDLVAALLERARREHRPPEELALEQARERLAARPPRPYLPPR